MKEGGVGKGDGRLLRKYELRVILCTLATACGCQVAAFPLSLFVVVHVEQHSLVITFVDVEQQSLDTTYCGCEAGHNPG